MANRTDTQSVVNLVINGQQAMVTQRELTDAQRRLNAEIRNMRPGDPGYREQLRQVQAVNHAIEEQRREIRGATDDANGFKLSFKDMAKGFGIGLGVAALAAIPDVLGKIKDAYAEAEKNRAVLTNAFGGDAKKAGESLKMLQSFAAQTPFAMQEATDAYIKLVNRGIIPTRDEMVKLGDLAASQGKGLDQLVEAVMDAQTGEFERLKEFGIRASKNGDVVALTFKGVTKEVKNTEEAIKNAVLGFGAMNGVAGTMETVSKTIVGLQSNIEDTWDQIFTKLGQGSEGVINTIYSTYSDVLGFINDDLLATESAGIRMTEAFKQQASAVNNLEKEVNPLIDRYDDLKSKGKLNKDEQEDLKNTIGQLALAIPQAVTEWDKYGNAISINTTLAKEFVASQRAMMIIKSKDTVKTLQDEIAAYTNQRNNLIANLRKGEVFEGGGGTGGGGGSVRKMNGKEIADQMKIAQQLNEKIKLNSDAIAGFNGNYMDELNKKAVEEVKSSVRTDAVIKKEIDGLKAKQAEYAHDSKEYRDYAKRIEKLNDELKDTSSKKANKSAESAAAKAKKKELADAEKLKNDLLKNADDLYLQSLDIDAKEIEVLDRKYAALKERAKGNADALIDIEQQKDLELSALYQTQAQRAVDIAEKKGKEIAEAYVKDANAYYDATTTDHQKAIDKLNAEYDEKLRLYEMFGGDMEQLARDYYNKVSAIEAGEDTGKKGKKGKKKLTKEEELELYKKAAIDTAYIIADTTFDIAANKREAESNAKLSKLEEQKSAELEGAEGNEAAKAEINARYAELEKQEKQRAWEANRKAAITQAIINGALAITNIWATAPVGPLGIGTIIPMAISAAATIASVAAISSQEMPEFADGVRGFKGGTALVGEAGQELIKERDKWWLTDGPTYADLAPGTDVYNAGETNKMLANSMYKNTNYTLNTEGARNAEMSYRNNSNSTAGKSASALNSVTKPASSDLSELKSMLAQTLNLVNQEAQKPVVLDYNTKKAWEKKMEYDFNSQSA